MLCAHGYKWQLGVRTLNLRINREIRALKVRVIDKEGNQLGILSLAEALAKAEQMGLDLVEIAPNAAPPVCKIIDYGKYRYQLTKKEKEQKKSQHQVKVKEIKIKPNTDDHDIMVKLKHARDFIAKGNKVRITCTLRGREMARPEYAQKAVLGMCEGLVDVATPEAPAKMLGRSLSVVLAPGAAKKSSKIV
ncbi:MAG: translation initiation factor IF-3 [Candidatus Rhabdochlamydia sp.]|jgi:translation initiation factor IF-3